MQVSRSLSLFLSSIDRAANDTKNTADVADLRDAVQLKYDNPNYLKHIPSGALLVYKNEALFVEGHQTCLKSSSLLDALGNLEEGEDTLFVTVASSRSSCRSASESTSPTGNEPNPKRKQRWIQLNKILEGNAEQFKTNDLTAYSYVTWDQAKTVFNPSNYVQPRQTSLMPS
jgi:hypothetical protein